METLDCREAVAEYFAHILSEAFESVTLDDIEEAFEVETGDAMEILFQMGTASASVFWDDEDDEDDPLHYVCVGDPDPTLDYGDDYDACSATDGKWLCTRLDNHPGQHIATDGVEVCGTWD